MREEVRGDIEYTCFQQTPGPICSWGGRGMAVDMGQCFDSHIRHRNTWQQGFPRDRPQKKDDESRFQLIRLYIELSEEKENTHSSPPKRHDSKPRHTKTFRLPTDSPSPFPPPNPAHSSASH